MLDPTVPLLQENKDGSWFARWLWEVNKRWTTKARMNTDGDKLHLLLRADQQFVNIHDYSYYSPIGWDGGDYVEGTNGSEVGNLMVLNVFVCIFNIGWRILTLTNASVTGLFASKCTIPPRFRHVRGNRYNLDEKLQKRSSRSVKKVTVEMGYCLGDEKLRKKGGIIVVILKYLSMDIWIFFCS